MGRHDHCNESQIQRPMRFGIMCRGTTFAEWQARCLENLLALDGVQVGLLIIEDVHVGPSARLRTGPLTKLNKIKIVLATPHRILFNFYTQFIGKPQAQRRRDLASLFSGVPSLRCKVIKKGKFSQYFSEADIETIRAYDLDFILRFGFGIIRGEILSVPRYGVWSFHHDDEEKYRGGPPCFWEIYNGDDVTGAILQRLTDRLDGGIALKKGFFRTLKDSYARNIDQAYYESAKWPAQVGVDIRNDNADYLNAPPSQTKAPVYHVPNNPQMLSFAIKILRNRLASTWKALFRHPQWNIGIVHEPIDTFLQPDAKPEIHWFPNPKKSRSLADPFGIARSSEITVLCEDFDYRSRKGVISSIELVDRSFSSRPKPAIDLPFHISYPYLFEHQGEVYCIPETYRAREISLYKAQEFPHTWTKIGTIVQNIAGIDPTVFQYEGLWWLTCTDHQQGSSLSLFIWYAPGLLGPWEPHAANPVKTDIRSARPAGTPFMHKDYLYRPAQDCSKTYGGRIVLNRVTQLTPTAFKEEPAGVIEPDVNSPFPHGRHTVSSVGNFTIVDGMRWVFDRSAARHALSTMVSLKLRRHRWLWPWGYWRRNA